MRQRKLGLLWTIGRCLLALALLASIGAVNGQWHAPASATTNDVLTLTGQTRNLLFVGRGRGHGVGLCQWGARGRAIAGQSATQIVTAYYSGTTVTPAVPRETTIRVLVRHVMPNGAEQANRIFARHGAWRIAGSDRVLAPDGYLQLRMTGGNQAAPTVSPCS